MSEVCVWMCVTFFDVRPCQDHHREVRLQLQEPELAEEVPIADGESQPNISSTGKTTTP